MYIMFPTYGDADLRNALIKRLEILGYICSDIIKDLSVRLQTNTISIEKDSSRASWTSLDAFGHVPFNHEMGDFKKLFTTDDYRFKRRPILRVNLGEYTAEVSDVIKVGCQTITGEQVEELYKAYKEYNRG